MDLLVAREQLSAAFWQEDCRDEATRAATLAAGEVMVAIERFALTANTITYGVTGNSLGYWQHFPVRFPPSAGVVAAAAAASTSASAPTSTEARSPAEAACGECLGRLPAWGVGRVVRSRADGVVEGERYYGFFPTSSHAVLSPVKVHQSAMGATEFVDGAPWRRGLPIVYLQYQRIDKRTSGNVDLMCVLRPLFLTSFLIADLLLQEHADAECVLVTSASSKTAIALAQLLQQQRAAGGQVLRVVGLTSAGNAGFVRSLPQAYDEVFTYAQVESIDGARSACLVDIAGNAGVRRRVHAHFGGMLRLSLGVGLTHHDAQQKPGTTLAEAGPVGGSGGAGERADGAPKSVFFFAPTQAGKVIERVKGPDEFMRLVAKWWLPFVSKAESWLSIEYRSSTVEIGRALANMVAGNVSPSKALIVSVPSRL